MGDKLTKYFLTAISSYRLKKTQANKSSA